MDNKTLLSYTESDVRKMRNEIYGIRSTPEENEKNWQGCKQHWMQPNEIEWLISKTKKI